MTGNGAEPAPTAGADRARSRPAPPPVPGAPATGPGRTSPPQRRAGGRPAAPTGRSPRPRSRPSSPAPAGARRPPVSPSEPAAAAGPAAPGPAPAVPAGGAIDVARMRGGARGRPAERCGHRPRPRCQDGAFVTADESTVGVRAGHGRAAAPRRALPRRHRGRPARAARSAPISLQMVPSGDGGRRHAAPRISGGAVDIAEAEADEAERGHAPSTSPSSRTPTTWPRPASTG